MSQHPDEEIRYTREDVLHVLADELGSVAEDYRIIEAYDQLVSEWAQSADDPDAEYARFFQDGPVATQNDLVTARNWVSGRILL